MLETKDYGFYEVKLVGTDDTEIIIGSSLESVRAEMEDMFGEMLDDVRQVSGDELATGDPVDADTNHKTNVSILTGRNPFAEALSRKDSMGKWITDFKKSDAPQFKGKSDEKKREMAIAAKLQAEDIEALNELSIEKLSKYKEKALDQAISKGIGKSVKQPSGTYKFVPASKKETETAMKRSRGAGLAKRKIEAKKKAQKESVEVEEAKGSSTDLNIVRKMRKKDIMTGDGRPKERRVKSNKEMQPKSHTDDPNSNFFDVKAAAKKFSDKKNRETWHNPNKPKTSVTRAPSKPSTLDGSAAAIAKKQANIQRLKQIHAKIKAKKQTNEESSLLEKGDDYRFGAEKRAMTKRDTKRNPQNKDQYESVEGIDTSGLLMEREDKLMYLVRIGLMNRNEMILVRRAMELKKSDKPMSRAHRDILFKLLDKMVGLVIKHPHMYNLAKRKIMSEAWDEVFEVYDDKELIETFIQRMDYLEEKQGPCWKGYKKVPGKKDYEDDSCVKEGGDNRGADEYHDEIDAKNSRYVPEEDEELEEAGYLDMPKTKAEVKKKFPDTETDVKNKNSSDLQTVKYK